MKLSRRHYLIIGILSLGIISIWAGRKLNLHPGMVVGQPVDSLHGVIVYYNGGVGHVEGRNTTTDGYNLGLKFQCVEFVKRYYYEHLHHKMPDSYGHAKDFFDKTVPDGQENKTRNLIQFSNPSSYKPAADDLLVFDETAFNPFGHVAIISNVTENEVEIVQQNPGPFGKSRVVIPIHFVNGQWFMENKTILGRLRKEQIEP